MYSSASNLGDSWATLGSSTFDRRGMRRAVCCWRRREQIIRGGQPRWRSFGVTLSCHCCRAMYFWLCQIAKPVSTHCRSLRSCAHTAPESRFDSMVNAVAWRASIHRQQFSYNCICVLVPMKESKQHGSTAKWTTCFGLMISNFTFVCSHHFPDFVVSTQTLTRAITYPDARRF